MRLDFLTSLVDLLAQVLVALSPLIQADIQRGDITSGSTERLLAKLNSLTRLFSARRPSLERPFMHQSSFASSLLLIPITFNLFL